MKEGKKMKHHSAYYEYNKDNLIIKIYDDDRKYFYEYDNEKRVKKLTEKYKDDTIPYNYTLYEYNKDGLLKTEREKSRWVEGGMSITKQYYYNASKQLIRIDEPYKNVVYESTAFEYDNFGNLKKQTETHKYNKNQNRTILYDDCGKPMYSQWKTFIDTCTYRQYENIGIYVKIDTTFINNDNLIYKQITYSCENRKTTYTYNDAGHLKKVEKYNFSPLSYLEGDIVEIKSYNDKGDLVCLYESYFFSSCGYSKPSKSTYTTKYEYYDNGLLKRELSFDKNNVFVSERIYEITYWDDEN